jgi:deazaflavin-dependent oxidoreductase (nitroreductase family)
MWFDPLMSAILRSPLHGLLSGSTMLITVRGKRSGRPYTTPVNYVRSGNELVTVSFRARRWWRNLRGGAGVRLLLQGREIQARAVAVEDPAAVADGLAVLVRVSPGYARHLGVAFDASGQPDPAGLARAAEGRVLVRAQLAGWGGVGATA